VYLRAIELRMRNHGYKVILLVSLFSIFCFLKLFNLVVDAFAVPTHTRCWGQGCELLVILNAKNKDSFVPSTKKVRYSRRYDEQTRNVARAEPKKCELEIYLQRSSGTLEQLPPSATIVAPSFSSLQSCVTPCELMNMVGQHIGNSTDPTLSSLVLVRLSKQLISIDNDYYHSSNPSETPRTKHFGSIDDIKTLGSVVKHFSHSIKTTIKSGKDGLADNKPIESIVQGTKASSTVARILYKWLAKDYALMDEVHNSLVPIIDAWHLALYSVEEECRETFMWNTLQHHHITGLKWAFDTFKFAVSSTILHRSNLEDINYPDILEVMYNKLEVPFCVYPGLMLSSSTHENFDGSLNVSILQAEIKFGVDEIVPMTNSESTTRQVVSERRQTAWLGDNYVSGFAYSGKVMPRFDWSLAVLKCRNQLHALMNQYYDCCLINLYHQSTSGMRYHVDPDQGNLWDYDTSVVSVGATRRFAFREIYNDNHVLSTSLTSQPHTFVVMDGDVTHMFNDCQQRYQHTVKKAENKLDTAMRASLVFKRSFTDHEK
jgi:alkylated DNA repair dioxygenase AlkB